MTMLDGGSISSLKSNVFLLWTTSRQCNTKMSASGGAAWICSACTFENVKSTAASCEMCATRRASAGSSNSTKSTTQQTTLFGYRSSTATAGRNVAKSSNETIDLLSSGDEQEMTKPPPRRKRKVDATMSAANKKPAATAAYSFFTPVSQQQQAKPTFALYTVPPGTKFTPHDIQSALKLFGLHSLRENLQPRAIANALEQKSQLLVLATGGGKSLCYQLPACLLGGVTIVISPLIALMQDQVQFLKGRNIPAGLISSLETPKQNEQVLSQVLDTSASSSSTTMPSTSKLTLLYITPESIQGERMKSVLSKLHEQKRLAMFAVDEAHCVSSWGHDFRPAYRNLDYLRSKYPKVPCLACTATATPQVIQDIQSVLRLQKAPLLLGSFDRPNIFYKVKYKESLTSGEGALQEMVAWTVQQHAKSQDKKCSGIIYVHKKDDTDHIARLIQQRASKEQVSMRAASYHGGLKKDQRNLVLHEWSTDKIQVAVATIAFGMGIDLPHVRYVIHWTMAQTVEGFYQESGRAGRDGLPSHSIVYYSPDDVSKFRYLIQVQSQASIAKKQKKGDTKAAAAEEKQCERKLQSLNLMEQYCTKPQCRRNALIQHFGGQAIECEKTCDFCRNPQKVKRCIQSGQIRRGDVFGTSKGRNRNRKAFLDDKGLAWDNNHGLIDVDEDNEDRIAQDWGEGMVGDLRVTDGGKGTSPGLGGGFVKASSLRLGGSGVHKGGFSKASDVLAKYAKLEEKWDGRGGEASFSVADRSSSASMVQIPEHFRQLPAPQIVSSKPKAPQLTSKDYGQKKNDVWQEIEALEAQKRRMEALIAAKKQQSK